MRIHKQFFKRIAITTLLFSGFAVYGIAQDKTNIIDPEKKAPVIETTSPSSGEINIDVGSVIKITFSSDMNEESINSNTLMLHAASSDSMHEDRNKVILDDEIKDRSVIRDSENSWKNNMGAVSGTISYSDKVAVFTPDEELKEGTQYTFTVTSEVKSSDNIPLESDQKWSFTTTGESDSAYSYNLSDKQNERSDMGETEDRKMNAPSTNKTKNVDLGKAGEFVILAKKDVNNESGSKITGLVGDGSKAENNKDDKDTQKQNNDQQSDQNNKTSSLNVTEAIEGLESTYSSMNQSDEGVTNHNTKSFHHDPALKPGVHTWDSSIEVTSDVTLSGSEDDVWIFKTSEDLTVSENTKITLADGAQANNVYWYVEGEASIGKNAEFEGIILSKDEITLEEGAIVNGRMFSQASVTLNDNTITEPKKPSSAPESAYSDNQNDRSAMNDRSNMEESENRSMYATSTNEKKLIELGKAGQFVILAKKDVNNESESKITGRIGEGSEPINNKGEKVNRQSNSGQNFSQRSNQSDTDSANVNDGINDMMSAFADASLENGQDVTTHNTESFDHDPTLEPGVHEWNSSLQVTSDVTLSGSADDVWIFKTNKDLTVQENIKFTLTDGAQADNVFWYVEGEVTIGENADFAGIILAMDEITLEKGAKLNGRMFSQTSINLDDNTVTEPRTMSGQTTSKDKN